MAKSFCLSDESINDRGYRVLTAGINLDRFKKNPIMLWMHRRDDGWNSYQVLPIGRWENIRIEENRLLADPVFDENDKFAQLIKSKVENDLIKGCSIGINRIEVSDDPKLLEKGQTRATITKSELYEASIVDMPSNKNTVRLFSTSEQTDDVPLINTAMAEKKDEAKFSFKSEVDLLAYMKEHFGLEPKAGDQKTPEKEEQFEFKNENSFLDRLKEVFGLQPKAKEPEKKEPELSASNPEVEQLKADLQKKDQELQELKSQNEILKKSPGAEDRKPTQETDKENLSGGDDTLEVYNSARQTWDAVVNS
jgi:hypothetical protein